MGDAALISADELCGIIDDACVKIFDVRGGWSSEVETALSDYQKGHIPGAIFLDWRNHFIKKGMARNIASVGSFDEMLASFKALGISKNDTVILYDDYYHMQAGRIWWAMQYWGFTNVRVLEGGWHYWKSQNLATSREEPPIEPVPQDELFIPIECSALRVHVADVEKRLGESNIIDARGPKGYNGSPDDPRSGHIPTAIHIPYSEVLDADTGLFKSDDALKSIFEDKLFHYRTHPIISSCGSGYAGTVILLALRKIGVTAPLFDGSFAIWKQNPMRDVIQGPHP